MEEIQKSGHFIENIINGMYDWVRVLDKDNNVIFMNAAMSEGTNEADIGQKCYKLIGRTSPCENCTTRSAVFDGRIHEKEEYINNRVFSVMSSPVRNNSGEIIAVVEVMRDTTQVKHLQQKLLMQNKKMTDDLNIAKKLQYSLLPKKFSDKRLEFSYVYKPCETLGGDFIAIFKMDDTHIGLYIADVSGHGVQASMLTVYLNSTLNKKLLSPSHALIELYRDFNSNNMDDDLYITVFYAVLDLAENKMTYSNAGHNVNPIIFGKGGCKFLNMPGLPISNWAAAPVYKDEVIDLNSEDKVLLSTDGIVEMRNHENRQFGEERLLDLIQSSGENPECALESAILEACNFAGIDDISKIPDDITIALLKLK